MQSPAATRREYMRERVEQFDEQARIDDEPANRCGVCRWCRGYGASRFPCPAFADVSDEQAMMAMVSE
jgi:hypothetical protein